MEMLKGISLDLKEENLNRLKEIFPEVFEEGKVDRKSTRLNSSHDRQSRMPSSA